MMNAQKIGFVGTVTFVIANMIGAGVFTSLGFQTLGTTNPLAIILLWFAGAVIAVCGALAYGELGASMPRSGGEYSYLSQIYHPAVGSMSGFVSMTVGFAAPVALASMAFGKYASHVLPLFGDKPFAIGLLIAVTTIHCIGIKQGVRFQTATTAVNVCLILVFVACGFAVRSSHVPLSFMPGSATWKDLMSPSFAVSLIYVNYAYSGWNAAAYISGEIQSVQKRLPLILLCGTGAVAVLYVLLNTTFLLTAPISELKGQLEVGYISARHIFGVSGATAMATMIALLLVSSVSSMAFVGPRVSQVMGEDMRLLKIFSVRKSNGVPLNAILLQALISLAFITTSSFDVVMVYIGFTLNLFTFLAVLGVFVYRLRFPNIERPFKTWGFPIVPLIFLSLMLWTMIFLAQTRPMESMWGFITALSGGILFFVDKILYRGRKTTRDT